MIVTSDSRISVAIVNTPAINPTRSARGAARRSRLRSLCNCHSSNMHDFITAPAYAITSTSSTIIRDLSMSVVLALWGGASVVRALVAVLGFVEFAQRVVDLPRGQHPADAPVAERAHGVGRDLRGELDGSLREPVRHNA